MYGHGLCGACVSPVPSQFTSPCASQVDTQRPLSLQDVSDPVQVVGSHGFKAGMVVFEKVMGPENALSTISSVGEPMCLEKRVLLPGELVFKVHVPVEKFLHGWSIFRGTLPAAAAPEVFTFLDT